MLRYASICLLLGCAQGPLSSGAANLDSASAEAKTAQKLEALRNDPAGLQDFLQRMPKGADLHNHLTGTVYAESYIDWASADGLCVEAGSLALVPKTKCSTNVAISDVPFASLVTAWSMQGFVFGQGESGHDHFFNAFGKFGLATVGHFIDSVEEAAARAKADHIAYVELMVGLTASRAGKQGDAAWGSTGQLSESDFTGLRDKLRASAEWQSIVDDGVAQMDVPGVDGIGVRYVMQASRVKSPAQVFAQLLAAHDIAARDGRLVAANLVGPEDSQTALRDYDLHMAMVAFLDDDTLHITLHAGELSPGSADGHVKKAIEVGHAERVGHAVDIASEGAIALLAEHDVLAEICLTSNQLILGVSGDAHPLRQLLDAGAPVALATDDQGVSRSSMTLEFVRAVSDQKLGYRELKRMVRAGVAHAFLPADERAALQSQVDGELAAFEASF